MAKSNSFFVTAIIVVVLSMLVSYVLGRINNPTLFLIWLLCASLVFIALLLAFGVASELQE